MAMMMMTTATTMTTTTTMMMMMMSSSSNNNMKIYDSKQVTHVTRDEHLSIKHDASVYMLQSLSSGKPESESHLNEPIIQQPISSPVILTS